MTRETRMPRTFGSVGHIAREAVNTAKLCRAPVRFEFNGAEVLAFPDSRPDDLTQIAMLRAFGCAPASRSTEERD